ncbi:hypothetical protein MTR62_08740 [Novosphingobium sp. 1949]|uniref:Uncharacterized protein n=1 Tax=Novosphingobium organovorum TaxID=2930092 RepID=A0ABT0BCM0_9SPHN|nr:hypothetical protein [Novosphingobium organovorum]MCJ2182777.1 hypothetical protein [Novosphingobium organovorum]
MEDPSGAKTAAAGSAVRDGGEDAGVSLRLAGIRDTLKGTFPDARHITLDFDGTLRAHIDIREGERVPAVEAQLAHLENGMFRHIEHGASPHHPFFHRISAVIDA